MVLAFLRSLAAEHKDILAELNKSGKRILSVLLDTGMDVGCGGGSLVKEPEAAGAHVVGIDTLETLTKATGLTESDRRRFPAGVGEYLPLKSDSVDILLYMASFHHIPATKMDTAMKECLRRLS
ncbi:MAG: methyltransferase domain-containing protein, partial [bacterium]|nr:methyltransferase domain-containing protein [bacterium]